MSDEERESLVNISGDEKFDSFVECGSLYTLQNSALELDLEIENDDPTQTTKSSIKNKPTSASAFRAKHKAEELRKSFYNKQKTRRTFCDTRPRPNVHMKSTRNSTESTWKTNFLGVRNRSRTQSYPSNQIKVKPHNAYTKSPAPHNVCSAAQELVTSSKKIEADCLNNEISDLKRQLQEVLKENKFMKALHNRQQKDLDKLEKSRSELPDLIKAHAEELRVQKALLKAAHEKMRYFEAKLKGKDDELLRKYGQMEKTKNLKVVKENAEKEAMEKKCKLLIKRLEIKDETLKCLNADLSLAMKTLTSERNRHNQAKTDMEELKTTCQELQSEIKQLKEMQMMTINKKETEIKTDRLSFRSARKENKPDEINTMKTDAADDTMVYNRKASTKVLKKVHKTSQNNASPSAYLFGPEDKSSSSNFSKDSLLNTYKDSASGNSSNTSPAKETEDPMELDGEYATIPTIGGAGRFRKAPKQSSRFYSPNDVLVPLSFKDSLQVSTQGISNQSSKKEAQDLLYLGPDVKSPSEIAPCQLKILEDTDLVYIGPKTDAKTDQTSSQKSFATLFKDPIAHIYRTSSAGAKTESQKLVNPSKTQFHERSTSDTKRPSFLPLNEDCKNFPLDGKKKFNLFDGGEHCVLPSSVKVKSQVGGNDRFRQPLQSKTALKTSNLRKLSVLSNSVEKFFELNPAVQEIAVDNCSEHVHKDAKENMNSSHLDTAGKHPWLLD